MENCDQSVSYQSGYDELVKMFQDFESPELLLTLDLDNKQLSVDPNDITYDQYYDYVHNIVERYDGDGYEDMPGLTRPVRFFEIGNEVDNPALCPQDDADKAYCLSLQNYVKNRLTPAYLAAKRANPDSFILNAGLFMGGGKAKKFDTTYLQKMLRYIRTHGGKKNNSYMDGVAIHYYYHPEDPEHFEENLREVRKIMNKYKIQSKSLWITEYGLATKNDPGGEYREEDQASVLLRFASLMKFFGISHSFIYVLKDPNSNSSDWEGTYGIFRAQCQGLTEVIEEKRAVKVFETFVRKTDGLEAERMNPRRQRKRGIYELGFDDKTRKVKIVWYTLIDGTGINPDHSAEEKNIRVSLDGCSGTLTDMDGALIKSDLSDRDLVTIGEKPLYIEYQKCSP